MQPDAAVLPFFDAEAAWAHFDAACRAGYAAAARGEPACEHNRAWREQGPGRGFPPDCPHNEAWRAEIAAWRQWWRDAQANAREGPHAA